MPDETVDPQPEAEPTVLEMLQARIDGYCRLFNEELDLLARVVEQLEPGRAESCLGAIGMARIAVDEIRVRAHGGAIPAEKEEE